MKYLVLYTWTGQNWSAHAPDVPGCAATGHTEDDVRRMFREALMLHLDGMREDGESLPQPSRMLAEEMEIAVPAGVA